MKFTSYFFLFCIIYIFRFSKCAKLNLEKKFPLYENEEFVMKFLTKTESLPLYTIVFLEFWKDGRNLENKILNPGHLPGLPTGLFGDYFSVLRYNITSKSVDVVVTFKKASNEGDFKIFYLETTSELERKNFLKYKDKRRRALVIIRISLYLHWDLSLSQRTLDHREEGLILGSPGMIVCRATGGSPFSPAVLGGTETLEQFYVDADPPNPIFNEAQFTFMPKIKDHKKRISCRAGPDYTSGTIIIFHHPTTIDIVPPVEGFVENGTTLLCKASDGFPTPISRWIFLKGPKHSEQYFTIEDSGKLLQIRKGAPLGSQWVFICETTNTIPNSLDRGANRTVTFKIGKKPFPTILVLSILISILLLICFIGFAAFLHRSKACSRVKKKSLTSGKDHGIFRYQIQKDSEEKKTTFMNGFDKKEIPRTPKSDTSGYKKVRDNPVDLV